MSHEIILASASGARGAMLRAAGVEFTVHPAHVDEESLKSALVNQAAPIRDIADALAQMKALQVSEKSPLATVIGADQVLECDGEIFSKPRDQAEAISQLIKLRGRRHSLYSGAVIARNGQAIWRHVGETRLTMRNFSDAFLEDYISRLGGDVLTTVGAYHLEDYGVRLFSRIEGDYFTVLGMPLVEILDFMAETGVLTK